MDETHASLDALTGALTRSELDSQLPDEVEQAHRAGRALSLVMLDLDHFKSVNDAFGHQRGDYTLAEFARRVRRIIRGGDLLFRYGGDEFVLLLPGTDAGQATALAERLLQGIAGAPFAGAPPLTLSVSGGVASFPHDAGCADDLLAAADRRHYHAKRAGRGQIVSADRSAADPAAIEPPARLIERDRATERLQGFLDALPSHAGSLLHIAGDPGCGLSRFIDAAAEAARIRRFAVLTLRGSPALRSRVRGALAQLSRSSPGLPPTDAGPQAFADAIARQIAQRDQQGLVIIMDDAHDVDEETRSFIYALLATPKLQPAGLIYAAPDHAPPPVPLAGVGLQRRIRLAPLSPAALRSWVRHALAWEIPDDVLAWLHRATGGLPRQIWDALRYLVDHALLTPAPDGWRTAAELTRVELGAELSGARRGPPNNLPASLSDFVGREEETQALASALAGHRLVSLVGPGGQGKTRLAIQTAAEILGSFPDGVFIINLTQLDAAELPAAVARTLGLALTRGTTPRNLLLRALHSRAMLLVLDNLEPQHEAEPLLEEILAAAPHARVLVTSRERLALQGAATIELRGLSAPAEDEPNIEPHSAVQLFVRSARQVAPEFELTPEDRADIARLCRLVGGMPLALTLAAGWARTHTCAEILQLVETSLGQLDGAEGGGHHSVMAVVESFWRQLSTAERRSLRRLAVFRGGFHWEAAADVAGASRFFLSSLVGSGYLNIGPDRRFEMHELLRQYAAAQLARVPEEETHANDAHAAYYAMLVEQHSDALLHTRAAVDALTGQLENIRAAYSWAVAQRLAHLVERCTPGLARLYTAAGYFRQGAALFADAIEHLSARPHTPATGPAIARLTVERLRMLVRLGAYDEAIAAAPQAVAAARGAADLEAAAYTCWGEACIRRGDRAAADRHLAYAARLAEQLGSAALRTDVLYALALCHSFASEYDRAAEYFAQGAELSRSAGFRPSESRFINGLGLAEYQRGNFGSAWHHFTQALPIFRELNDRQGEALVLSNLAEAARHLGRYQSCRTFSDLTLRISRAVGDQLNEAEALICLGLCLMHEGDAAGARALSAQALQIAESIGARSVRSRALTAGGMAALAAGAPAEAEASFAESAAVWHTLGQPGRALEPLAGLVAAALAAGDEERAFHTALQLAEGLAQHPIDGAYEPARIYLSCFRALYRRHQQRAAEVLRRADAYLRDRIAAVDDEDMRRSFLEHVEANRELADLTVERALG